jgi:hypothetical protein
LTRNVYEPQGVRFYELASKREMILVTDDEPQEWLRGWLCWHHPDGQWVTLRKANKADLVAVANIVVSDDFEHIEVTTSEYMDHRHWQFPHKRFVEYGPEDEWWAVKYGYGFWVGRNAIVIMDADKFHDELFGSLGFDVPGMRGKKIICHPAMLNDVIRMAFACRKLGTTLVAVLPLFSSHLPTPDEFVKACEGLDRPRATTPEEREAIMEAARQRRARRGK